MARYPNVFCLDCGKKKLYYQKELSTVDRKNPENNIPVYWCTKCEQLIQIRRKSTADSINSVKAIRVFVYKNKNGRGVYERRKDFKQKESRTQLKSAL